MSRILKLFCILVLAGASVKAQPIDRQQSLLEEAKLYDAKADELMKLNFTEQKEAISAMPINEAIAIKDAAVRRLTKSNIEANTVFYLYDHLAALQANDLAEKRLERLMAVFIITLLLFGGYLIYLMISQNRAVRQLMLNQSQNQEVKKQVEKGQPVIYRGE
ncbi:MAG: hypothetical protein H3C43_14395 [Leptonema sp. (in: Bacteria)]|nr:hypothetical protein [Leptonema sp. (in: bacteria)]